MDADGILAALRRLGVPHDRIAVVIGRDRTAATKMMRGTRSIKANEIAPLAELVAEFEKEAGESETARQLRSLDDEFEAGLVQEYVSVEILPTYAGAGPGGNGDGDRRKALLPRALIEDELRARPSDVLVIVVRGNSMEPDFYQGDQVVIDRRETNPVQPGPFAIWYDEGYALKNLERVPRTSRLRVFSSNSRFSDREEEAENLRILGRPVWFARRV